MKTNLFYLLLALITGALIPIQASTNAAFSKSTGSPMTTGLMVLLVGFVGMFVFSMVIKTPVPTVSQLRSAPFFSYLGGLIVATYVVMITFLVPRVGVGPAIAFIVTGQIICATVIDHFGLFGVHVRLLNTSRLSGVVLMIAGIYFVMRK